jgi:hypothetical protein
VCGERDIVELSGYVVLVTNLIWRAIELLIRHAAYPLEVLQAKR